MAEHPLALGWVRRLVAEERLPVAVFGVATSQGVQLIEAVGDAGVDDHFALFSITKPLVGLATARVVEQGLLSLRRPLVDALPGFGTRRTDVVRLWHLLSHTAGISDPALDDPRPLEGSLLAAGQDFVAGAAQRYSNIAFQGVAALLLDATGETVYDHVERLNGVAGRGGITFEPVSSHPVHGGERIGFRMDRMQPQRHPAAGSFGTAEALLNLASALLRTARAGDSTVVSPATLAGMLRPRTLGLPEPTVSAEHKNNGLTWHLRQTSDGLLDGNAYGHAGLSGTQWWIYPERDAAFVLLTNLLDLPGHGIDADELNNAFVTDID